MTYHEIVTACHASLVSPLKVAFGEILLKKVIGGDGKKCPGSRIFEKFIGGEGLSTLKNILRTALFKKQFINSPVREIY